MSEISKEAAQCAGDCHGLSAYSAACRIQSLLNERQSLYAAACRENDQLRAEIDELRKDKEIVD